MYAVVYVHDKLVNTACGLFPPTDKTAISFISPVTVQRAALILSVFPVRARKRTLVHRRAETLRAEKIGALSHRTRPTCYSNLFRLHCIYGTKPYNWRKDWRRTTSQRRQRNVIRGGRSSQTHALLASDVLTQGSANDMHGSQKLITTTTTTIDSHFSTPD